MTEIVLISLFTSFRTLFLFSTTNKSQDRRGFSNTGLSILSILAGRLAQLVERSSGDREVPGSIPSVSRSSEWALQLW